MGQVFRFEEKGSRILREWNEARRLERALQTRTQKQMRVAGFAGAAVDRLTASLSQWSGSINADLDGQLAILRARARALAANNEHGRRFVNLVAANIVGQGPRLQVRAFTRDQVLDKPANDAIETHWARWGRRAEITGRMGFAHMLRVMTKAVARDGEALVRKVRNRNLPYGMALQLLEADRLDDQLNATLDNGNTVRMGVEVDAYLRPVAYHIKTAHPGEAWRASAQTERVPARDVYHVFLQERAEQVRGYTWMHAVLQRMNMLHAYEEAAVVAARVGASKMGIFTRKDDAPSSLETMADEKDPLGNLQMSAEPGEFLELPPGYSLDSWDPDYPHANFESFLKACMRGVASGLDLATHNLAGDMTDVNYSSARIAELTERDAWKMGQDWLHEHFLVPLYQDWLASAMLLGQITFEGTGKALPADRLEKFLDVSRFQGRRWPWVDPVKDIEAYERAIALGVDSRTAYAAAQGKEIEDVMDELAQEKKYAGTLGLELASGAPAKPQPKPDQPTE